METALATHNGNTRSIMRTMAERFGMESGAFERTLMDTVMPKNTSKEAVAAFLVVAHEHGLNPFTREIFAFEGQGGGVRPIVSIDGWIRIVNAHPQFDGCELVDVFDDKGNLVAVESRFYRKDREHPMVQREYLAECGGTTIPWKRWPRRMLKHKAYIQGARYAFGFAGIEDEDEFERYESAMKVESVKRGVEIARVDLSRARPGVAVNPPGGATIGTASSRAEPMHVRVVEARPEPAAAQPEPVQVIEDSDPLGLEVSDSVTSRWYSGIEIFPDTFPDGWQRGKVSTKPPLDAFTFETIAQSNDPKVMASVSSLLKLGAEKQAAEGRVPVQFQQLAEAIRAHAEQEMQS